MRCLLWCSVSCGVLFFVLSRLNKHLTLTFKYFIHTQYRLFTFVYYFYVLCFLWRVPQKSGHGKRHYTQNFSYSSSDRSFKVRTYASVRVRTFYSSWSSSLCVTIRHRWSVTVKTEKINTALLGRNKKNEKYQPSSFYLVFRRLLILFYFLFRFLCFFFFLLPPSQLDWISSSSPVPLWCVCWYFVLCCVLWWSFNSSLQLFLRTGRFQNTEAPKTPRNMKVPWRTSGHSRVASEKWTKWPGVVNLFVFQ